MRWSGDFRALWVGETTRAIGANVSQVALPLVASVVMDAGPFEVALLTAAGWAPWLLRGLPSAGAWVDRLRRCRPLLVAADLVSATLLLAIAVLHAFGVLSMGRLMAVAIGAGARPGVVRDRVLRLPPRRGAGRRLPSANAALQSSAIRRPGRWAGAVRTDRPAGRTGQRAAGRRREIAAGLRYVERDPYLRILTAFGAASNIALIGYQSLLVILLVRHLDLGSTSVGLVLSGSALGGVLGAVVAGPVSLRFGTARGMLVCQFGAAPFALLIPLATPRPGVVLVALGGLGVEVGLVAGNDIKTAFRQTHVPRHLLGRVVVSMQAFNYGAIPAGRPHRRRLRRDPRRTPRAVDRRLRPARRRLPAADRPPSAAAATWLPHRTGRSRLCPHRPLLGLIPALRVQH